LPRGLTTRSARCPRSHPNKVAEYKIPGTFPFGLVDGPCDNTIWYTDDTGFRRIQLPGPLGLTGVGGLPGLTNLIGSGSGRMPRIDHSRRGKSLRLRIGRIRDFSRP
jgi:hypothetical protein